jgi:hypothetical protein
VNEGFVRLGQFDNFIFAAFQKVYSCQNIQARFLINLSKRLLDHAHMAVAGHPDPDWNPEDLDGPSDKGSVSAEGSLRSHGCGSR